MSVAASGLKDKLLSVCKPYLGPATDMFISRQCSHHLKVTLDTIGPAQLPDLAKWVEISAGLIMEAPKAAELAAKIRTL